MTIFTPRIRMSLALWHGRLIGAFVVVQLVFLLAANFLPLLPQGKRETEELTDDITWPGRAFEAEWLQRPLEFVGATAKRYGEATGQMQNWSLFAPGIAPQATFPVVELRWDEAGVEPVQIRSEFLPDDPRHYVRVPITNSRIFNYEFRMTQALWFCTDESLAKMPEFWETWVPHRVSRQRKSLRAYLEWKTATYLQQHPELAPPTEARLLVRCYWTPPPGSTALAPPAVDRPLVRLRFDEVPSELEVFEPVRKEFQPVRAGANLLVETDNDR